jgi:hypothetical protein
MSCAILGAQREAPERMVRGNVITSPTGPVVKIELPRSAKYVGAERWLLYGVADCELHVFVDSDARKIVQRLYWVQFEQFLPSRPNSRYNYPFTRTLKLGGLEFDVRARFGPRDEPTKPGSDLEHVRALIQAKGYQLPPELMNVRLVHLPDENKRRELMIIYAEDLTATGFTAAELAPERALSGNGPSSRPN